MWVCHLWSNSYVPGCTLEDYACVSQDTHSYKKTMTSRTEWLRCLLCKHEDLSSIPRTHAKTRWAWGCHVKVTAWVRQRKVGIWGSMPATLTYLESSRPSRTEHLSKTTKQGSRGAAAEASRCTTCSECAAQLIWKSKEQDPHTSGKEDGKCF